MGYRVPILSILMAAVVTTLPCHAEAASPTTPVSELVIDASTGRSLYASYAMRRRPPASLAKMMTLLLVFDALDAGRLKLTDRLVMTASGARQAPSRLDLRRGRTMSVESAVRAVAVISANDVAVALADRPSGDEASFVARMNHRAAEIGMTHTNFRNATGLGPRAGHTTATDMAKLAQYIIRRHPDRYKVFGTRSVRWKGWIRPNHNQLLGKVQGMDGVKTGYTVAAGFSLAASARRAGKRVIVIVMGARTAAVRDLLVANLLESGFSSARMLRPMLNARLPVAATPSEEQCRLYKVTNNMTRCPRRAAGVTLNATGIIKARR